MLDQIAAVPIWAWSVSTLYIMLQSPNNTFKDKEQ